MPSGFPAASLLWGWACWLRTGDTRASLADRCALGDAELCHVPQEDPLLGTRWPWCWVVALEGAHLHCSLGSSCAKPRHLWVESWVESHLCNSPTWVFVSCRTGRHMVGCGAGRVGTFSRCRHRADTRAVCGRHWLATLMGCWLTSPQTFPATPRSPHRPTRKQFRDR